MAMAIDKCQPGKAFERGALASRPVTVNIARDRLCLALGSRIVRSRKAERIKIGKALENGAHGAAGLLRDLDRRRHNRIPAKQLLIGLDNCQPRPLAAQAAAIDLRCPGRGRFFLE